MKTKKYGTALLCFYTLSLGFASFPPEFLPKSWKSFHSEVRRFHRNLLMEPGMGVFKGDGADLGEHLNCFQITAKSANSESLLYETFPNCKPANFLRADLLGIMLFRALSSEPITYPEDQVAGVRQKHFQATARFFCQSSQFGNGVPSSLQIDWTHTLRRYGTGAYETASHPPYRYDCRQDVPLLAANPTQHILVTGDAR